MSRYSNISLSDHSTLITQFICSEILVFKLLWLVVICEKKLRCVKKFSLRQKKDHLMQKSTDSVFEYFACNHIVYILRDISRKTIMARSWSVVFKIRFVLQILMGRYI